MEKEKSMQLNISRLHINVTDALHEFFTTKFSKQEQYSKLINQVS